MTDDEIEATVSYWLQYNMYPPVPQTMVEPCVQAIHAALADEWEEDIALPDGVTYKGNTWAPAHELINQHYLWAFIEQLDLI